MMLMSFIELTAHVNEHGKLELPESLRLPPGEVRIIIEPFDAAAEAADEALWQKQFAESPDKLDFLINEGLEALRTGEAEDLDLDHDLDDL
jgi:hypothetical protein